MPVLETTVRTKDDQTLMDNERTLYSLAELKELDDDDGYLKALAWIAEGESEVWDPEYEIDYILEVLAFAGLHVRPRSEQPKGHEHRSSPMYDISYTQGSMWFSMPDDTTIDEAQFLQAMKLWAMNKSFLPKGYKSVADKLQRGRTIKVDLRSKDARIIREQGLVLKRSAYSWGTYKGNTAFDDDYQYDDVSDDMKELINEFLQDLTHWAMTVLRDDYEWRTSDEEYLAENAEANEWLFTEAGRHA